MIRHLVVLMLFAAGASAETLVFARGADNALWMHDGARWTSLGGTLASAPDAASWGNGRVDVFVRGTDDHLWQIARENGRWSQWFDLGGTIRGGPSAVSRAPGRIDVVALGADRALWHKAWDGTRWSEWTSLGGELRDGSSPDLASWSDGRLDVFARGTDDALWQKAWDGAAWSEWTRLGGQLASDPGVVSWGPNRIDVFARGNDRQMWQIAWDGSRWTEWIAHDGELAHGSGPDAASAAVNHLAVFGRGSDDAVWLTEWTGSQWTDWRSLGGKVTSDPTAIHVRSRARFRVTLTGFEVARETWDDALERDGKRDEVFLVHEARVLDAAGNVLAASGVQRGSVMGDVNRDDWRTSRVLAGTASALGGLKTGDAFATSTVLWEGELAEGGESAVIVPTIWEWDGDPDFLNRALGFLGAPIILAGEGAGIALTASPEAIPDRANALLGHVFRKLTGRGELGTNVTVTKNVFGDPKDRPIGMKDAALHYVFEPQALHLTHDSASAIARTDFGRGAGVLTMRYRDAEELKGDYALSIRVERVN